MTASITPKEFVTALLAGMDAYDETNQLGQIINYIAEAELAFGPYEQDRNKVTDPKVLWMKDVLDELLLYKGTQTNGTAS